MPSLTPLNYYK